MQFAENKERSSFLIEGIFVFQEISFRFRTPPFFTANRGGFSAHVDEAGEEKCGGGGESADKRRL